ncbi:MAG: hypothetical protein ACI9E5_001192 [Candidatus Omnitrophota bacterium]|jgi:hypothetical protein
MSPKSIKEYTTIFVKRYKRADYNQKKKIIDEYCKVTGYHRKHAIRKLNNFRLFTKKKKRKRGRTSKYNKKPIIIVLKKVWLTANLPCSKILKSLLPLWIPHYVNNYGSVEPYVLTALESISPATIDRIFKPIRPKYKKKGLSGTKPGSLLRNQIPIKTSQWNETVPGYIESDTVHHCGNAVEGQYALTVNYDDIATGWTEQRAVWGKGETGVLEQTKDVENSLPFKILGFDSDNGGEFINNKLHKYFTQRSENPVEFTRSRAYKKNDNAHIEQKNWTHVRQWLGYNRFDNPKIVALLNDLFTSEWNLYHNFFIPSVKLIEKKRIASKTIKRYDTPKTPYQRLLEADLKHMPQSTKDSLTKLYETLDPFKLRLAMEKKIDKILKLSTKI